MDSLNNRGWWLTFIFAPLIVAVLEILWNLPFYEFPIYWLPTYAPVTAIMLNGILHILLTVIPFFILSSGLYLIIRRKEVVSIILIIAAALYLFAMGSSVMLRVLSLTGITADDVFTTPVLDNLWMVIGWGVLVAATATVVILHWSGLVRRGGFQKSPAWPATIVISAIIAIIGLLARWPQVLWRWPTPTSWTLFIQVAVVILAHVGLWVLTRRFRPSIAGLGIGLFAFTLCILICKGVWIAGEKSPSSPNFLFVLWDAGRADRMSLYGHDQRTTPFVEGLAEHAVVFTKAHSPTNYTLGSHVGIFTGLYSRQDGIWSSTLPELEAYSKLGNIALDLNKMGYQTLLITENPWVAPLNRGFDKYYWVDQCMPNRDRCSPASIPAYFGHCVSPFFVRQFIGYFSYLREGFYKYSIDDYLFRKLQIQLLLRNRSYPFYCFFNIMNANNRTQPYVDFSFARKGNKLKTRVAEYDLAIKYADIRFQKLVDIFKQAGMYEQTIFLLTGDHGESLSEHGFIGHKTTLFEQEVWVPLLIAYAGWPGRLTVDSPVSLTRIKDAIEMMAGGDLGKTDFQQRLVKGFDNSSGVLSESEWPRKEEGDRLGRWRYAYVTKDKIKLIRDPKLKGSEHDFLFDLNVDMAETVNLYDSNKPLRAEVLQEYNNWRKSIVEVSPLTSDNKHPPGLEKRLRAMGYLN